MDKPIVDEVIINPNPQGWFNRVYIHHLLDPRHPVIFSDDWDVQSPPKRVVFRFHYHSQKVIRSLGITWFGFLTPHDSRSRHLRDYVKILDMSWGPESVSRSGVSMGGVRILIVYLLYNENIPCHHGIVQFSNWNLFIDKSNYILCPQLNDRQVPLSTRHLFQFCHFFKQFITKKQQIHWDSWSRKLHHPLPPQIYIPGCHKAHIQKRWPYWVPRPLQRRSREKKTIGTGDNKNIEPVVSTHVFNGRHIPNGLQGQSHTIFCTSINDDTCLNHGTIKDHIKPYRETRLYLYPQKGWNFCSTMIVDRLEYLGYI